MSPTTGIFGLFGGRDKRLEAFDQYAELKTMRFALG
jgi:hypothetical protein